LDWTTYDKVAHQSDLRRVGSLTSGGNIIDAGALSYRPAMRGQAARPLSFCACTCCMLIEQRLRPVQIADRSSAGYSEQERRRWVMTAPLRLLAVHRHVHRQREPAGVAAPQLSKDPRGPS
jgi:hypothetical protein